MNFGMLQCMCINAQKSIQVIFRIVKIEVCKSTVVVFHAFEYPTLIVRTTKLTHSFLEKFYAIFCSLTHEVLHDVCLFIQNRRCLHKITTSIAVETKKPHVSVRLLGSPYRRKMQL